MGVVAQCLTHIVSILIYTVLRTGTFVACPDRIRGVVANYLASQARDPGFDSHQHQKKINDIYMGKILFSAAICTAG